MKECEYPHNQKQVKKMVSPEQIKIISLLQESLLLPFILLRLKRLFECIVYFFSADSTE